MSNLLETNRDLSNEWFGVMQYALYATEFTGKEYELRKIDLPANKKDHVADYYMVERESGKYVAAIEFKERNYTLDKLMLMGGVVLSRVKYDALLNYKNFYPPVRPVFLIRCTNGLYFIPLAKPHMITEGVVKYTRCDPPRLEKAVYFNHVDNFIHIPDTGESNEQ